MMKNQSETTPETGAAQTPDPDQSREAGERWDVLHSHIAELAHRRSRRLLAGDDADEEAFDRGARSLRTLMSAAEITARMKREEAKEVERDEKGASANPITDAAIEDAYRQVARAVERIEREDADAAANDDRRQNCGGAAPAGPGPRRETLEN